MPIERSTQCTLKCDGPDCKTSVQWFDEQIHKDKNLDSLPEAAFGFLIVNEFSTLMAGGSEKNFCSKFCLLNWLKTYVKPKTPKELVAAAAKARLMAIRGAGSSGQNPTEAGLTIAKGPEDVNETLDRLARG